MLLQEDPSAEHLLDLAGRLDCLLRLHRRQPALAYAEDLLETLGDHHQALQHLRQRCDDDAVELLEDLAVALIAEVALLVDELRQEGRWPDCRLRREVAGFAVAEAATAASIAVTRLPVTVPTWSRPRTK